MKILGVPYSNHQLLLASLDVLVVAAAIMLGQLPWFLSGASELSPLVLFEAHSWASLFFLASTLALLYVLDLHDASQDFRKRFHVFRILLACLGTAPLQLLAFGTFPNQWWGRSVVLTTTAAMLLLLPSARVLFSALSPEPPTLRRAIVLGTGHAAALVADAMTELSDGHYEVLGFIRHRRPHSRRHDDQPAACEEGCCAERQPLLGDDDSLMDLVREHRADEVVVAIRGGFEEVLTEKLLRLKASGVHVSDMTRVYKDLTGKVPLESISKKSLIFGSGFTRLSRTEQALQRITDLVLAGIAALLSAPIVLVAAVAVKLESRGPAFYTQERLGKDGVPFRIIKLRTMRTDAEADGVPKWSKGSGDPRVTRVGRFLRRSRIDEIPQFYNVLKGEMSMVGPRPERAYFVEQLKEKIPFYSLRFAVAPGVTGWAQVKYRYGATDEDAAQKLSYELYAIQEMSPMLYLVILLKTVQTVLLRPGS